MVDWSSLIEAEIHYKWGIYHGMYRTYVTDDRRDIVYSTPTFTAIPDRQILVADWRLNDQ